MILFVPCSKHSVRSTPVKYAVCVSDVNTREGSDRISYCSVQLLLCCVMLYQVVVLK